MTELTLLPTGPASRLYVAAIPADLRAQWCAIDLHWRGGENSRAVIVLDLDDDAALSYMAAPGEMGVARVLLYLPVQSRAVRIELMGATPSPAELRLEVHPISRLGAALRLLARAPWPILRAVMGARAGWSRRVRAALALASGEAPPASHALWTTLFDYWTDEEVARLAAGAAEHGWPTMLVLVMCAGGTETKAARATLESLAVQALPARVRALTHGTPLAEAINGATETYVALLQAGEVVPRHMTALFGAWIAGNGSPLAVYADEDALDADGARDRPLFKPDYSRSLMRSGTLTRGVWLFRQEWMAAHGLDVAGWAEVLRLDLALHLDESGQAEAMKRVPFILTHRRDDAEAAPAAALEATIRSHLDRLGASATIIGNRLPLRVRPNLPDAPNRRVALLVPSTLRGAQVRRCLRAVLDGTAHPALEVLIVVSQLAPLDAEQKGTLAIIGQRARVLILPVERFNYSLANNFAARQTGAEFLCLLNDDVAPRAADWLDTMLGHFADPSVGGVGAKLLYDNATIQHGGIIVGLAGLAEHANRGLDRDAPGYAHRAVLSQDLSAVTGACLLVRRAAWERVGGMDEGFPIAFNDVDVCLKLRRAGYRIVFCAEAEMTHYESVSLGHHFSGERAKLERQEVRRMRERWADVVAADPFHNPNLSLVRGQEWRSAFPPRVRRPL